MTQFVDVTISDSVPTGRLFAVSNIDYSTTVATWLWAGASFDASTALTFSLKPPSARSTRTKIRARVVIPIMDPVLTTKKIDEVIGEVTFSIPKISTLLQRQNCRAFIGNFLANATMTNAVDFNQGVY